MRTKGNNNGSLVQMGDGPTTARTDADGEIVWKINASEGKAWKLKVRGGANSQEVEKPDRTSLSGNLLIKFL